jgi:hypothetical protein
MGDIVSWFKGDGEIEGQQKLPKLMTAQEVHLAIAGRSARRALNDLALITRQIAALGPDDLGTYALMLRVREAFAESAEQAIRNQARGRC